MRSALGWSPDPLCPCQPLRLHRPPSTSTYTARDFCAPRCLTKPPGPCRRVPSTLAPSRSGAGCRHLRGNGVPAGNRLGGQSPHSVLAQPPGSAREALLVSVSHLLASQLSSLSAAGMGWSDLARHLHEGLESGKMSAKEGFPQVPLCVRGRGCSVARGCGWSSGGLMSPGLPKHKRPNKGL